MVSRKDDQVVDLGPEWARIKRLGGGAHGSVDLFRHNPTMMQFAVKFVPRGSSMTTNVEREVLNHAMLNHPKVVRFKEVMLTPTKLAVISEYCSGGDVFNYVMKSADRKLPEHIARFFFQQFIEGLEYMHAMGVGHRDLKLENMLLDGNPPRLKICDFGYSKSEQWDSAANSKVGTAAYVAPEVIINAQNSNYDAMAVDVWSAGVVLHTLLAGIYPFCNPQHPNNEQLIMKVLVEFARGHYPYIPPPNVSPECSQLLQRMLTLEPSHRIKIQEIRALPWFSRDQPGPSSPDPAQNFVQQELAEVRRTLLEARTVGGSAQPKPGVQIVGYENSVDPALSFESLESSDMPIAIARRATLPQDDPAGMVMMRHAAQVQQARAEAAERKATQVQAQAQAQPQAEPSQAAAAAVAPAPQAPPQGQPPQPTVEEALRHLMMTVENGSS